MFKEFMPIIESGDNLIIATGDSFTQGLGAYPETIWQEHNYDIDCVNTDMKLVKKLLPYIYENSWVNQLCKNHLKEYKSVNLGCMGVGNRAAAKELFLNPIYKDILKCNKAIVVYMMSGMERFDFVNKNFPKNGHFYSMWPSLDQNKLWECYARDLWSDRFVAIETIINIVDVQNFCKSHNFELILTSGFDNRINIDWFKKSLPDENHYLIDLVNWDKFFYPKGCRSFLELLLKLDGHTDPKILDSDYYKIYYKTGNKSKYITPCVHPSEFGHKIIAEEIYKFISKNLDS